MSARRWSALFISILLATSKLHAQENIPIGIFRIHASFNTIHSLSFDGVARTFAAAPHGVLVVDRAAGETSTYTKVNGLSGGTITSLAFEAGTRKLVVGYAQGYIDVLNDDHIIRHFDPVANVSVSGSTRVNEVIAANQLAYIATDYGVVVFDLKRDQVRETWRDLGISGEPLPVHHCALTQDSVFLATPQGLMAGKLTDNLQDFSKWKRYLYYPFSNHISGLALWKGKLHAAVDQAGLFRLEQGVWTQVSGVPVDQYFSLQASGVLTIAAVSGLYEIGENGVASRISSPLFSAPRFATSDLKGARWVGDEVAGLLTDSGGDFASMLPQCPANDLVTNVHYANGKVFAVGGGTDESGWPLKHRGVVDKFESGVWTSTILPATDVTDVTWDESTQTLTAASYGAGVVVEMTGKDAVLYNETNSTLLKVQIPASGVLVTSVARVSTGAVAMNYGVSPELHEVDAMGKWKSYSIPAATARYGQKMVVDDGDNIWIAIDPKKGGGIIVTNRLTGDSRLLTEAAGQGALPHPSVLSLCLDRDGAMWIGTAEGVAYIPNASSTLEMPVDAIKPILEGRFVLREDAVTAIAVDGGNRKWFGTQRGAWLYNAAADKVIGTFTAANSALPSDRILDIDIHQESGEVFIATDQGLASYRSGATSPGTAKGPIKIFPNPIPSTFSGSVGITGTPTDAVVKITDASGRLVWETRANGSTATWNLNDDRGRRVPSGMYIVFTVSADGDQHEVGKLAVVN